MFAKVLHPADPAVKLTVPVLGEIVTVKGPDWPARQSCASPFACPKHVGAVVKLTEAVNVFAKIVKFTAFCR